MKRMVKLYACFAILLLCTSSMKAFAGGENKSVQGKTIFLEAEHSYTDKIEDDRGKIITEEGTEITIEGKTLDDYTLRVVELFAGDEAFEWLEEVTKNYGTLVAACDVLLEDENGNFVIPEKGFMVTISSEEIISPEERAENMKVFHVDTQGVLEEIKLTEEQGKRNRELTTQGRGLEYYVLLKTAEGGENKEENAAQGSGSTSQGGDVEEGSAAGRISVGQVKTGDMSSVEMTLFMVILSILAGALSIRKLRRDGW